MELTLVEVAERIRTLRDILDFTEEEMAEKTGVSVEEYRAYESGNADFTFTFIFKCAEVFGVDMIEILTGEKPKLSFYSIVRSGTGLPISRRKGFSYQHLAYRFTGKTSEPFLVTAPYSEEEQDKPIHLSHHEGQEFDYIISGHLKVALEDKIEILGPGDAIYYDSSHGHGMIATGGEPCTFLAMILKK